MMPHRLQIISRTGLVALSFIGACTGMMAPKRIGTTNTDNSLRLTVGTGALEVGQCVDLTFRLAEPAPAGPARPEFAIVKVSGPEAARFFANADDCATGEAARSLELVTFDAHGAAPSSLVFFKAGKAGNYYFALNETTGTYRPSTFRFTVKGTSRIR